MLWKKEKIMVTAKVSKKGQVVIPAQLRRQMGIEPGSEVIRHYSDLCLKRLQCPDLQEDRTCRRE